MNNMSPTKTKMPTQLGSVRATNIEEVALGYTEEMAQTEAQRCLNCVHKPCMKGCPVQVQIPAFIEQIKLKEYQKAYEIIKETSTLPAICGRVCPQENQCEKTCVRGIKGESVGIGYLERFVADWANQQVVRTNDDIIENNHRVAIIGSGPAGLTCAGDLRQLGYDVTIFEALHKAGGVLVYGIPEFRLPKAIVQKEIDDLLKQGVHLELNSVIGKSETIDDLLESGFEAVFIASGAGLPSFMNMPGESLNGVYSANEFLTRFNLMKAYEPDSKTPILKGKKVVVVGGGNVAMDAARCAKRLCESEVVIVYRRSMNELPARGEEVEHAIEEGIQFNLLTNPVQVLGKDGWVSGVECVKMELKEADASGRRSPVEIVGSNFVIEADEMIMAIGTSPNPLIKSTTEHLETNRKGCIVVDENLQTTKNGVFAGGDAISGAATVIQAMGAGKKAAQSIDSYIKSR